MRCDLACTNWASSRLEGNAYTRLDTQNLIEFGRIAEGKEQLEAFWIETRPRSPGAIEGLVQDGLGPSHV